MVYSLAKHYFGIVVSVVRRMNELALYVGPGFG